MAAKEIIILNQLPFPGYMDFRYALWAAVPVARQSAYANPNATSAWTGASAAEITALQNGSVVESVGEARFPTGTSIPTIEAELIARFTIYQAQITAANPWQYYGSYYDGTSWTANTQA